MVEIRINNTGDGLGWLYNNNQGWKDYCGCENFDEQVVLTGNRDFTGCTEAEWYQKAKEVLDNIDCYDEYPTDVSDEVNTKLKEMYDKCRCTADILVEVIRLFIPKIPLKLEQSEDVVREIGKIILLREMMWIQIYLKQCILGKFLILPLQWTKKNLEM